MKAFVALLVLATFYSEAFSAIELYQRKHTFTAKRGHSWSSTSQSGKSLKYSGKPKSSNHGWAKSSWQPIHMNGHISGKSWMPSWNNPSWNNHWADGSNYTAYGGSAHTGWTKKGQPTPKWHFKHHAFDKSHRGMTDTYHGNAYCSKWMNMRHGYWGGKKKHDKHYYPDPPHPPHPPEPPHPPHPPGDPVPEPHSAMIWCAIAVLIGIGGRRRLRSTA